MFLTKMIRKTMCEKTKVVGNQAGITLVDKLIGRRDKMLNHAVLMGRLTRDPELRYTQTNLPVASFTLAVDRDASGPDREQRSVDFINIVAWRGTAEFVSKWFRKGQLVAVSGRIQLRNWKDREENQRTSFEIKADTCYFAEAKREGSEDSNPVPSIPGDSEFVELLGVDPDLPF